MMKWFKLKLPYTNDDFIISLKIAGKTLCVVRDKSKLYIIRGSCPHAGGLLSDGWCENGKIVCPIHRYQYDLITGKGLPHQRDYIHIYPVEERMDGFYVGLKLSLWDKLFAK